MNLQPVIQPVKQILMLILLQEYVFQIAPEHKNSLNSLIGLVLRYALKAIMPIKIFSLVYPFATLWLECMHMRKQIHASWSVHIHIGDLIQPTLVFFPALNYIFTIEPETFVQDVPFSV